MEPEGSLPCSQDSATGPYPDPDESNPQPHTYFPKIHSNIIFPSAPSGLFSSGIPFKLLYAFLISPMHVTSPAHLND